MGFFLETLILNDVHVKIFEIPSDDMMERRVQKTVASVFVWEVPGKYSRPCYSHPSPPIGSKPQQCNCLERDHPTSQLKQSLQAPNDKLGITIKNVVQSLEIWQVSVDCVFVIVSWDEA